MWGSNLHGSSIITKYSIISWHLTDWAIYKLSFPVFNFVFSFVVYFGNRYSVLLQKVLIINRFLPWDWLRNGIAWPFTRQGQEIRLVYFITPPFHAKLASIHNLGWVMHVLYVNYTYIAPNRYVARPSLPLRQKCLCLGCNSKKYSYVCSLWALGISNKQVSL